MASAVTVAKNPTINKIWLLLFKNSLFHLSEKNYKVVPFSTLKRTFHDGLIQ